MSVLLDPRLPAAKDIDEPNRQQGRRIARKPTLCPLCYLTLSTDDLCFADGTDAHRSCAEQWNAQLFVLWDELREQDEQGNARERALDLGLAIPRSELWTPTTRTATATS